MKKILLAVLVAALTLGWFPACPTRAEERAILTIGDFDTTDHSDRLTGEDQLGMWRYLEDQIGMEIQYIFVSRDQYTSMMNSGNLPECCH